LKKREEARMQIEEEREKRREARFMR